MRLRIEGGWVLRLERYVADNGHGNGKKAISEQCLRLLRWLAHVGPVTDQVLGGSASPAEK